MVRAQEVLYMGSEEEQKKQNFYDTIVQRVSQQSKETGKTNL